MITVGGFNPIPKGSVSASPEYFYYGEEVIGGVVNVSVQGTHHSNTASEYSGMIDTILGMIDTCQSIVGTVECGGDIDSLDGAQGIVKDVSVSPGGGALDLSYSINLECAKDSTKTPLIKNQTDISVGTIDSNAILSSFEGSTSFEDATSSTFVVDGNSNIWKSHGKATSSVSVGLYDADRCDSNAINYQSGISAFLDTEINKLMPVSDSYIYYGLSSNKSIGKTDGSATFEMIAAPKGVGQAGAMAMVDYSISKTTDQKTKLSTATVKGSIQGIDGGSSFSSPSYNAFDNAKAVYGMVSTEFVEPEEKIFEIACPLESEEISAPPAAIADGGGGGGGGGGGVAGGDSYQAPDGTCLKKYSTRVSEIQGSNRIDFETVYKEVEECDLLGYKIKTNYEERPSVHGRAEHLAPNRGNFPPLVYESPAVSAPKYRLTVTAEFPSTCTSNPVGPSGFVPSGMKSDGVLESAVNLEFVTQKTRFSLNVANIMRKSRSITDGRYSYSITEEYIKCQ